MSLAAFMCAACAQSSDSTLSLVGPADKYRVLLAGGFAAPRLPDRTNIVTVEVASNDGFRVAPFEIYHSDFLDRDFRDRFSTEAWLVEDAIQMFAATNAKRRAVSTIAVHNDSDVEIPVLQIEAGDLVLAFRVAPGSRKTFNVMWGAEWDACVDTKWRQTDGGIKSAVQKCFARTSGNEGMSFSIVCKRDGIVLNNP